MNLEGVSIDFFKAGVFVAAGKVMMFTFLLQTSFWKDLYICCNSILI